MQKLPLQIERKSTCLFNCPRIYSKCLFFPSISRSFHVARLQLKINYFLQKSQSDKKKLRNRKPLGIVVLCHFVKFVSLLRKLSHRNAIFLHLLWWDFSVIYVSSDQLQFRMIKINFQGCGFWKWDFMLPWGYVIFNEFFKSNIKNRYIHDIWKKFVDLHK